MIRLGVNIDHVATVRQARRGTNRTRSRPRCSRRSAGPTASPSTSAKTAGTSRTATCDLLRHRDDRLNLEMAAAEEIIAIALKVKPDEATLVPEKAAGTDHRGRAGRGRERGGVRPAVERLKAGGIHVSLFIDPDAAQVDARKAFRADAIEFQTASYSEATVGAAVDQREVEKLRIARRPTLSHWGCTSTWATG